MKFGLREITLFALLLALLGISWYFVKNTNDRRAFLHEGIRQKTADLQELNTRTAGIPDVERKIADIQKAIVFFDSKLPKQKEADKIMRTIAEMASANSLEVKSIKMLAAQRYAGYSEQPMELVMSGNFEGFYSLLLQLEKDERITRIHQMNLQKIQTNEGQMTAKVTLSIFFEPDTTAISPATATVQ